MGVCFVFVGWFAIFGGPVFGPCLDEMGESIRLHRFLYECEPDAVRFTFYLHDLSLGQNYMSAKVNFTTGKRTIEAGGYRIRRGLFWQPQLQSVFSTITFALAYAPSTLADGQISEIKKQLSAMPLASQRLLDCNTSRDECHVAFYRGSDLQVEHFLPENAPAQLREIYRIIGFSSIYDRWNVPKESHHE